ncbi:hypothetical protein [Phaeodactylibacter sp.]|jgi:hypothetical protein|uniref:hypothetical protein n=1 Tax=Phaeodactylibacter sp. TaxID=1940289 RepID=UPI0025FF411E|nr:hypothetical protein [Phaeodactylibacter sp.]MCI4651178.1 hypothetical protein [Phaeodactylibacter sp.]MCI5090471.1 hypothetical protein [Phaeodactylibacter sp.]
MNIRNPHLLIGFLSVIIGFCACSSPSFEDQIRNDILSKMASGICDSIPEGSTISNIQIGEIVDIGMQGMTDVSISFDYEHKGDRKHHESAMLYLKRGRSYTLAALGGCEYEME